MKKIICLIFAVCVATLGITQTQSLSEKAHKPLTAAQKATTNLVKTYNLTAEQAKEVMQIQENKYQALAKLEKIKASDLQKYIAKRLSAFEIADNALMVLLDESQMKIFKQKQVEKSNMYDSTVMGMKKQGFSQADINNKLAEMEF